MEDIKLQPTVKSAIMFEEMTGKRFFVKEMEEIDMMMFMYCVYVCSVERISFEAFSKMFSNKRFAMSMTTQWKRFARFSEQFKYKTKNNDENSEENDENADIDGISMKEIAKLLVFKYGLDPHYVFNEVELWELDYLITIGEQAYRDKEEETRLWNYLQIIPHLDPKKSKNMSAEKFFPFPWEENVHTKEGRKKVLEREEGRMKKTIGMHLDI